MTISATAKSKFSIGTTAPATDATTFAADTYTAVANIEDLGEVGSEAEILVGKYVDQAYARKLKGSRDNGTMTVVVARDPADAGQTALRAAEKQELPFNFKVELNDKPATDGTNTVFYFKAIVASAKTSMGGADDVVKDTYQIAITGAIFEVPAATAP